MSREQEIRDIPVVWEEPIVAPEPITEVAPKSEFKPEMHLEEDPEPEEEEEELVENTEGAVCEDAPFEEDLLLGLLDQNIELGDNVRELEAKVQELQEEKQELHAYWEEEITNRVRAKEQVNELEKEVRAKKVRIDRMSYAFRTTFGRLQHRVYHHPAEEGHTRHTISKSLFLDMVDKEYTDARRRGLRE